MKLAILAIATMAIVTLVEAREPRFAPYVYATTDISQLKQKYGLKSVSLAFLMARGTCVPMWNAALAITDNTVIGPIKRFQASGGEVIVSSGGAAVPYIETGCKSAGALAGAYKLALDAVGSTHLDLDIESAIDANMVTQAVAQLQKSNRALTFSLTIAVDNHGITAQGVQILQAAVKNGVVVDTVNTMTMDYKPGKAWYLAVQDCVEATKKQLKTIWPSKSDKDLYGMIGITPMIGQNDDGTIFTLDDATKTVQYAKSKGIGHMGFWSVDRDNGNCGFEYASDRCSGVKQSDHQFTKIFNAFAN